MSSPDLIREQKNWPQQAPLVAGGATLAGLAALAAAALLCFFSGGESLRRLLYAYLVNYCFFLSISLGALFFVLIHHLTRAGWGVVLRRLAEGASAAMPWLFVLSLPILLSLPVIYHWAEPGAADHDALLKWKEPYLNARFFILRVAGYFLLWSSISRYFFRRSVMQDESGDPGLTSRMESLSAPSMIVFALTTTFASFDLLMSLDPHWFSTIFGVYFFAGCVASFFAALALTAIAVQASGSLKTAITIEHYHDMGKFIFAFVVFWAYIAFSQYMLIWYANLPEETAWLARRQSGPWLPVSAALLAGHFFVPFLAIMSRRVKRRKATLGIAAVWILLMHWLDLFWLAMPEFDANRVALHPYDLLCFVGIGGVWLGAAAFQLRNVSLAPRRDPRLSESLAFENA